MASWTPGFLGINLASSKSFQRLPASDDVISERCTLPSDASSQMTRAMKRRPSAMDRFAVEHERLFVTGLTRQLGHAALIVEPHLLPLRAAGS